MKKAALVLIILCCAFTAFGGFKAKQIKAKKPGKFQTQITVSGVTFAADLLLEDKEQKKYFNDALTPSNIIAVRLAVFNEGNEEVVLPLNDLRLQNAEGIEFPRVEPDAVAKAVLGDEPIVIESEQQRTRIGVVSGGPIDPRYDPNDPGYDPDDPRNDPNDPRYDPRNDPNDPRYDPNDPRHTGQYPPGTYPPNGRMGGPGILVNPGGMGDGDQTRNERMLIAVDFRNKAHTSDPVICTLSRDRFLYFSIPDKTAAKEGFVLILPVSKGIPQEIILKF